MPGSERYTTPQLKDDLGRQLRSTSPAIKRPASDMGAQDREEHTTDVEMSDGPNPNIVISKPDGTTNVDVKAKQQDTGQRHREKDVLEDVTRTNDNGRTQQQSIAETGSSSSSYSLVPTPSIHSSDTASSMNDAPSNRQQPPSIDEQVVKITELVRQEPEDGQVGYIISTRWLHRVQMRSSHPPEGQKVDKSATEGSIGPIDNSDLIMITEDSGRLIDEKGMPYIPLRPGLTLGEDYQILPEAAWSLCKDWYDIAGNSTVPITRYAHEWSEGDALSNIQYELNPPIFTFLKVPSEHTTQTQREKDLPPVRFLASKTMPFMQWLKKAKEILNIDMTTKVRVWRILGGLKSSTASGILTPAASRSASPAPGAEIVASAGDHLLLDVNTFAALQIGEHREQLDQQDQTANSKYNGKVTLGTVGLGRDDVIVLEEQKPTGGDWPSESTKLQLSKSIKDKAKGLTPSGRSSPSPGMVTRGRQRRDGRPKGITGLSNLGNTCYMNSALQCIRSVEELTQYFLHDQWKKDLNVNNPLGHHGEVAKAYANLLHQIYDENASSTNPSKFKATIGKHGSSFSGYQQQDSQEFLLFLLDGLQEDLNRIHKKPYIEKPDSTDEMVQNHEALKAFADKNWDDYKARNDSVITDLFAGMYKSTLTCPVCQKVSIIFDPFNNLTLQLPIENNWSKEILYFPLHQRPYRVDVDIDKHASIRALKEFVAQRTHADPDYLVMAESYKNKFYKIFDNGSILSEANIQGGDIVCVYELDSLPTNYNPNKPKKYSLFTVNRDSEDDLVDADSPAADRLLVPLYHRLIKAPGARPASKPFFGQPTYLVINRESNKTYDGILKKIFGTIAGMTTKKILDPENMLENGVVTPEDSDTVIMNDDSSSLESNQPKIMSHQAEDGFVDVSMRDASEAPDDSQVIENDKLPPLLRLGTPIPSQFRNLFNVTVAATGEGIPTGWSQINEHNEYDSLLARVPKTSSIQSTRSKNALGVVNADEETASSDEDVAEIEHDEAASASGESGTESNTSAPLPPSADSDTELPDPRELVKEKGRRRNQKTYSRKGRKILGRKVQNRRTPPPPPQPHNAASGEGLIRPGEAIVLDWSQEAYDALFGGVEDDDDDDMRGAPTWKSVELLADEQLTAKRAQRSNRRKNGISLEDCLNEFGKSETLSENNAWFCPRCKEHRRANKMFELWKAPDILVMHLKRFSSNRNFRDKLEVRVEYPIEGLDLSTMVRDKEEGKSLIYDLIAVDNHYGGLGGGHYTAYAKNFFNQGWYEYNDSHVSGKSDARGVVTPAAYLLFYRRRSDHPLGGEDLEQILTEVQTTEQDSEMHQASRDNSPMAGEDQRLGDSSHNGLSSAFQAGQAHLVGDGGPVAKQNRGLLLGDVNPPNLIGTLNHDDSPPAYTEAPADDEHRMQTEDDEGIGGMDFSDDGPSVPWAGGSGWDFSKIQRVPVPSEDEDMFGDAADKGSSNDSTRVEGDMGSPRESATEDDDIQPLGNDAIFSEGISQADYESRNMRESAPPPSILPEEAGEEDDGDEDLPVMELKADPTNQGELTFAPAKK